MGFIGYRTAQARALHAIQIPAALLLQDDPEHRPHHCTGPNDRKSIHSCSFLAWDALCSQPDTYTNHDAELC
jgi:hypothetical protein